MTWGKLQYDGVYWTRSKTAVQIPVEEMTEEELTELGYDCREVSDFRYPVFGRECDPEEEGAKRTNWVRREWEGGERVEKPLSGKPVECTGFGGTGLMYGGDGYAYLMYDGVIYVRSYAMKKTRYLRVHPVTEEEDEMNRRVLPNIFGDAETLYRIGTRHRSEGSGRKASMAEKSEDVAVELWECEMPTTEVTRRPDSPQKGRAELTYSMPKKGEIVTSEWLENHCDKLI